MTSVGGEGRSHLSEGQYDWGVSGSELPREQWADVCSQVCINRCVRKGLRVTERRTGRVDQELSCKQTRVRHSGRGEALRVDEGWWGAGALLAWLGSGSRSFPSPVQRFSSWGPRWSLGQGAPNAVAGRMLGARSAHADAAEAAQAGGRVADGVAGSVGARASSSQPGSCARGLQSVTETQVRQRPL